MCRIITLSSSKVICGTHNAVIAESTNNEGVWFMTKEGEHVLINKNFRKSRRYLIAEFNKNHDKLGKFAKGSGTKEFTTTEAANKFIQSHGKGYSKNEREAIIAYGHMGFLGINSFLRTGKQKTNEYFSGIPEREMDSILKGLDSATQKTKLKKAVTVYRGFELKKTVLRTGDTIKDKGFMSTSLLRSIAVDFAPSEASSIIKRRGGKSYIAHISLGKGQHGIFTRLGRAADRESEFILPRGTSLKVTATIPKDNYTEVHLEVA